MPRVEYHARNPWDYLNAFPPPYCRLLAKQYGSGTADLSITDAELAIKTGIPINRIREISLQDNWDSVVLYELKAIFEACNFDPTNSQHRERVNKYEAICKKRKTIPFQYLRCSPKWESEFLPLFLKVSLLMNSTK